MSSASSAPGEPQVSPFVAARTGVDWNDPPGVDHDSVAVRRFHAHALMTRDRESGIFQEMTARLQEAGWTRPGGPVPSWGPAQQAECQGALDA
jgi:hypothetical protein